MKIGFLLPSIGYGGAERVVSNIINNLGDNIEPVLITMFNYENNSYEYNCREVNMGIDFKSGILSKILMLRNSKKILNKIKKQEMFDVVVSFLPPANIINASTKGSEKVILSVRNYLSYKDSGLKKIIYKRKIRKTYKNADKIIACAKEVKKDLVSNYKLTSKKIEVQYNPIDIDITKLNYNMDGNTIINVGRLCKQKGQWHLIRAMKHVVDKRKDIVLKIFGNGELNEELQSIIKDENLENNVKLMGYSKDIYNEMSNSSILAVSSLSEGIINVVTEALHIGLPIVSVDCKSGPRELISPSMDLDLKLNNILEAEFGILSPEFSQEFDIKKSSKKNIINEKKLADAILNMFDSNMSEYSEKGKLRAKDFGKDKIISEWIEKIC